MVILCRLKHGYSSLLHIVEPYTGALDQSVIGIGTAHIAMC